MNKNNIAKFIGVIANEPTYAYSTDEHHYYRFTLDVMRKSEKFDHIPCVCDETLIDMFEYLGCYYLNGYIRAGRTPTKQVFQEFRILKAEKKEERGYYNRVELDGYLVNEPIYRETPNGYKITEMLIGVPNSNNRNYYLPTIRFHKNGNDCKDLSKGSHIKLTGTWQSRDYQKKVKDGDYTFSNRVYEVVAYEIQKEE